MLEKGKTLYKTQAGDSSMATMDTELMSLSEWGAGTSSMLGQVSGVVKQELLPSLERVIFRATRGNAVFESIALEGDFLDS